MEANAEDLCVIDADCQNFIAALDEGKWEEANRRAYTLLRSLHRELPTHKVQLVLAGVPIEDVIGDSDRPNDDEGGEGDG